MGLSLSLLRYILVHIEQNSTRTSMHYVIVTDSGSKQEWKALKEHALCIVILIILEHYFLAGQQTRCSDLLMMESRPTIEFVC